MTDWHRIDWPSPQGHALASGTGVGSVVTFERAPGDWPVLIRERGGAREVDTKSSFAAVRDEAPSRAANPMQMQTGLAGARTDLITKRSDPPSPLAPVPRSRLPRMPTKVDWRRIPKKIDCAPKDQRKQWPCILRKESDGRGGTYLFAVRPPGKGPIVWQPNDRGGGKWILVPPEGTVDGRKRKVEPSVAVKLYSSANPKHDDRLLAIQFAQGLKGSTLEKIKALAKQNAMFVVSHSGGKDSQAMYLYLRYVLKVPPRQLYLIHADLPGADWPALKLPSGRVTPDVVQHIRDTVDEPLDVVQARWGASGDFKRATFVSLVRRAADVRGIRHPIPSPSNRTCTKQLKTSPINRQTLAELCRRDGLPLKSGGGCGSVKGYPWRIVVMCLGLRKQESTARQQEVPLRLLLDLSTAGRAWFRWNPILDWSEDKVFKTISKHGQDPFWTYGRTPEHMAMIREKAPWADRGLSRLSCQFCIMTPEDWPLAAALDPKAAARNCKIEREYDTSWHVSGDKLGDVVRDVSKLRRQHGVARNPEDPWGSDDNDLNPWDDPPEPNPHDLQLLSAIRPQTPLRRAPNAALKRRLTRRRP